MAMPTSKRRKTLTDGCPHCASTNVSPLGGGAQGVPAPPELLYECQEPTCGKVYVRVSAPR